MADLNEIYNTKLLELAASIPHSQPLAAPDARATAHSKLCGSTVGIELKMEGGRVSDYAQTVKACLLGQAAASVIGSHVIGASPGEIHAAAGAFRRMLKEGGPPPTGRFADLEVLEPVRHYKARHGSVMLVFDAIEKALADIAAAGAEARTGAASA